MAKLTDKQLRFIDEYLIDMNGRQSAIRSGYSPKTAEVQASRLLSNANVQEELAKRQKKLQKRVECTQEWVVTRLMELADKRDQNGDLLRDSATTASMQMLGKHLGMYIDKQEVKMSVTLEQMLDEISD